MDGVVVKIIPDFVQSYTYSGHSEADARALRTQAAEWNIDLVTKTVRYGLCGKD